MLTGSPTDITIDVTSYTNHEKFIIDTYDNDITIIELAQAVDLNTYTPACMAKTSDTTTFDWKNAWVYGEIKSLWSDNNNEVWSWLGENGGSWESPLEVEVPVVTQETCMAAMSDTATITEGMICAGGVAGRDSCQVRQIFGKIFSQMLRIFLPGRLWWSPDLQERHPACSHR